MNRRFLIRMATSVAMLALAVTSLLLLFFLLGRSAVGATPEGAGIVPDVRAQNATFTVSGTVTSEATGLGMPDLELFTGTYPAPVEKTGQTKCYDANGTEINCTGTGQDGEYQRGVAWPIPRFTAHVDNNGDGDCNDAGETCDGTVTDNLTGLIWLKDANCDDVVGGVTGGANTWADALTFSNNLVAGRCELADGSSAGDWRLPNAWELSSLTDFSQHNPGLPSGHPFTDVQSALNFNYWSSTPGGAGIIYSWSVNMLHGEMWGKANEGTHYVWPVRGDSSWGTYPAPVGKTGQTKCYDASGTITNCTGTGQDGEYQRGVAWPIPRFTAHVDNNGDGDCNDAGETCDGTVTDNLTGLIWLKDANCGDVVGGVTGGANTWADALTFSNNLAAGRCELADGSSAGDWRLPNVRELSSLTDCSQHDPVLPSGHPFTDVQSALNDNYWSSTSVTDDAAQAWYMKMHYGEVLSKTKTCKHYVWPVRGYCVGYYMFLPVILKNNNP